MALIFIEGWDLHSGPDAGAVGDDWDYYWTSQGAVGGATYTTGAERYELVAGYSAGQAMKLGAVTNQANISGTNNLILRDNRNILWGSDEIRVGFFLKLTDLSTPAPEAADEACVFGFSFGHPFDVGTSRPGVVLVANGSGSVKLAETSEVGDWIPRANEAYPTTDVVQTTGYVAGGITTDWVAFEIYANKTTGVAELYEAGVLVGSLAGVDFVTDSTDGPCIFFTSFQNYDPTIPVVERYAATVVDHIWVTDGNQPAQVNGVAITMAVRYASESTDGLVTDFIQVVCDESSNGDSHSNIVQDDSYFIKKFIYGVNPVTGLEWTTGTFGQIERWGIEYWEFAFPPEPFALGAMILELLDARSGEALVTWLTPDAVTVEGSVTKSNEGLSYVQHIDDIPRDPFATDEYLTLDAFGERIYFNTGVVLSDCSPEPALIGLTFAQEYRTDYTDWVLVTGGDDFESYFISGYKLPGEGDKKAQSNYVTVNYQVEDDVSALIQGIWDYATDPSTGRFTTQQQVCRLATPGFTHAKSKLKIRGHGRVLQFKVFSEATKPFFINGWTVLLTGNDTP